MAEKENKLMIRPPVDIVSRLLGRDIVRKPLNDAQRNLIDDANNAKHLIERNGVHIDIPGSGKIDVEKSIRPDTLISLAQLAVHSPNRMLQALLMMESTLEKAISGESATGGVEGKTIEQILDERTINELRNGFGDYGNLLGALFQVLSHVPQINAGIGGRTMVRIDGKDYVPASFLFRQGAGIIQPAILVAERTLGAMPDLVKSAKEANRLFEQQATVAQKFRTKFFTLQAMLEKAQEEFRNGPASIQNELKQIAEQLHAFNVNSDTSQLSGMDAVMQTVETRVANIAIAHGKTIEIPEAMRLAVEGWAASVENLEPFAVSLGLTRAALWRALTLIIRSHRAINAVTTKTILLAAKAVQYSAGQMDRFKFDDESQQELFQMIDLLHAVNADVTPEDVQNVIDGKYRVLPSKTE